MGINNQKHLVWNPVVNASYDGKDVVVRWDARPEYGGGEGECVIHMTFFWPDGSYTQQDVAWYCNFAQEAARCDSGTVYVDLYAEYDGLKAGETETFAKLEVSDGKADIAGLKKAIDGMTARLDAIEKKLGLQ